LDIYRRSRRILERAIIVVDCVTFLGTPITITLVGYATSSKEYNPIKVKG